MKRSLVQSVQVLSTDRPCIAMADPFRVGLTGQAMTATEVRNSNPSGVRETNRVFCMLTKMMTLLSVLFNNSAKKYLFLFICILACTTAQAGISLESITPANNSEITSFDFSLKFDISTAKAAFPDLADQLGVGSSGTSKKFTALYKGDEETGELIGSELTKPVTGAKEEFTIGDTFKISFADIIPEEGVKYTLVINNTFSVFSTGATKNIGTDYRFDEVPLVYTFFGKGNSVDFVQISASILKDSKLESFNDIKLAFNLPISVSENAKAILLQGEEEYANTSSFTVDPENENAVIISFDNVPLYKNTNYTFVCEAGSILMKDDTSKVNEQFTLTLQGDTPKPFAIKEQTPGSSYNGILTIASVKFELPEKAEILESNGATTYSYPAVLYKKEQGENLEVANLLGTPTTTGDGVIWKVNSELIPETEYAIVVPPNTIYAYTYSATTGRYSRISDMSNGEIEFSFTTPTAENSNLDPMVFATPAFDESRKELFNTDEPIEYIEKLYFQLENNFYSYLDENLKLNFVKNKEYGTEGYDYGVLYKVTEAGDVKIKDIPLGYSQQFTTDGESYWTAVATFNNRFYDGTNYKFVIPEGVFTVSSPALKNFIHNEEITIEFAGKADANLQLTCSSLREGERVSHISAVAFHSDQEIILTESNSLMVLRDIDGKELKRVPYSIYHENTNNVVGGVKKYITRVMADFSDRNTFSPFYLPEDADEYQIVIAPGTFSLANDPEITNEEIVVNIKRVPESGLPEYVNLTSVVNEYAATVLPIEKGLKAKLQLTPSDDWKIERVVFNGKDVTANVDEDGNYETPAVRIDSRMEVHLAFDGELIFEDVSGVIEVPGTDLRVSSEEGRIKVSGLSAGDDIKVYTPAGILIAEHTASESVTYIAAPEDAVYIVVITGTVGNRSAVKIRH